MLICQQLYCAGCDRITYKIHYAIFLNKQLSVQFNQIARFIKISKYYLLVDVMLYLTKDGVGQDYLVWCVWNDRNLTSHKLTIEFRRFETKYRSVKKYVQLFIVYTFYLGCLVRLTDESSVLNLFPTAALTIYFGFILRFYTLQKAACDVNTNLSNSCL